MANRRLLNQLLDTTIQQAASTAVDASAVLRFGTVTAVSTGTKTLTATVNGSTLRSIPYLRSYTPAVNDVVWLLHQNSIVVALGAY